ncbi:MAG: calcium/sodium antiporter, partial [Candidatus Muiribacteriota bacterium]
MLDLIIIIVSFAVLIKGADYLIDGASSFAKKLGIPDIVIGLSLVAFGTSAPELAVNVVASFQGNSGITLGNVLGSNIANIFLILGITSIIKAIPVAGETVKRQIPFALLAAVSIFVISYDALTDRMTSLIGRGDGIILLLFFSVFLYYIFSIKKDEMEEPPQNVFSYTKDFLLIIGGLTGLILGGKYVVNSSVNIAKMLGLSETVIGLSIVAIGTSLPELITCVVAALKNKFDIAVGNIVGSNIFNTFLILGISSAINPVPVANADIFNFGVNIGAVILLLVFMFTGIQKNLLERWEGIIFVLLYISYITY